MGLVDRIGKAEGALAFWDRVLKWMPAVLGTGMTSAVAGWASWATNALNQYAPLSWVLAAMLGGVSFLMCRSLWYSARLTAEKLNFAQEAVKRPISLNPLDSVFTKQRVALPMFRGQFNEVVDGKTFVDCEIYGPAVIFLLGGITISGVDLAQCEFVRVRNDAKIANAIPFGNLTITRGKMRGLTILVPEAMASTVSAGISGIEWITH